MEKNPIILKLNKSLPGKLLEARRFSHTEAVSLWIGAQSIPEVATFLKEDSDFKLDWLENLSIVEFENVLIATYFVRSTEQAYHVLLRASVVLPSSPLEPVFFPSIRSIWPMGGSMEREAEEMFGICFFTQDEKPLVPRAYRLPAGWEGYPLRKNYVFPKEVMGIKHRGSSRTFTSQDPVNKDSS